MNIVKVYKDGLYYQGRYDPKIIEAIKEIPGREWKKKQAVWTFPATMENVTVLSRFPNILISQDALDVVNKREETISEVMRIKNAETVEPVAHMPVRITPYLHQVKCFNMAMKINNIGILFEQGCGKSLTAIAIMGRKFLDGDIKKVLIVAPISVMPVWSSELEKAEFPYETKLLMDSMVRRSERLNEFTVDGLHVAITNYESVWRDPFFDALIKWKPDMIVCDESQKIKGVSTNQSKGMRKLGDVARYKMILTGTPVTASPLDFWAQYRFLDPSVFGKSYFTFARRYAIYGGYEHREVVGFQNKEELVQKAHSIAHRVSKDDALDLPEQVDQVVYVNLEPSARRMYDAMKKENIAAISDMHNLTATNVLVRLLRLQQMTGGFVPRDDADDAIVQISTAKLDLLKEMLTDFLGAGHKIVVFVRFLPEIHAIIQMLDTHDFRESGIKKLKYSYIYGAVDYAERGEMVNRFQTDPECRVFVAQIQTAGLGITLHAADISIFYSLDFNFANWDQCKARIHRIGQDKKVTHIHILANKTIDSHVYDVLKQKKNVADDVVDNWRKYLE